MLLKLNDAFEGYTPLEKIGRESTFRETYRVMNSNGKMMNLVIYDMNAVPVCYQQKGIPEIEVATTLKHPALPTFIAQGNHCEGNRLLKWLVYEYPEGKTLAQLLEDKYEFEPNDTLKKMYHLLVGVNLLSKRLRGGSHNNISLDTIWSVKNELGEDIWRLQDLSCAAEPCQGQPPFDTEILPFSYKAPETMLQHYHPKTDIFAMGIVLALLLQKTHPWAEVLEKEHPILLKDFGKIFFQNTPRLLLSDEMNAFIGKAIANRSAERFQTFEDFGKAIAHLLGDTSLNDLERADRQETASQTLNTEALRVTAKEDTNQPRTHLRFERAKGLGFQAVAGMQNLKRVLTRNFVDIVQHKELAAQFQIAPPNGMLLWGPPGTGKTYLSMRLAEETQMLYCLVQPSDLGNTFVHGTQQMIADLFNKSEKMAEKNQCAVLLIFDEFDSLVPKRELKDDNKQANEVAEFLTRLNNCGEKNVFVVGTTNRIEAIDPAITRKGRMDEIIYVGLPDDDARKELLELELKNRPHDEIQIEELVKLTQGYTSSDISFIVKESARRSFAESVQTGDFVKISQSQLVKTIASTRASISADELRRYEQTQEFYVAGKKQERPRIGF